MNGRIANLMKTDEQDWFEQCLKCIYSYKIIEDEDMIYCANGECIFKERGEIE